MRYVRVAAVIIVIASSGDKDQVVRGAADSFTVRDVAQRSVEPSLPAGAEALPRFEEYLATARFHGSPAPVRIHSATYGRMFRTRLRKGALAGPNFAGAFTLVTWGCGTSCQITAVIDARTGRLSKQTLRTTNGLQYRTGSRLVVADPIHPTDPPHSQCAACGTPAAYVWSGTRFEPVGAGPHRHLSGERPWEPSLQHD
jgi:hypothetical protein